MYSTLGAVPKISVVSTKVYTNQLVSFYMIALDFDIKDGTISREYYNEMIEKLKEISYIHVESFVAGELKHGTGALIEEGNPVVAIATQEELFEKMLSNMKNSKLEERI